MKRGIIQSRGLGDIIIALPIARHYYEQGDEIHWPICSEFAGSFRESVPWVTWHEMETDATGQFFLAEPLQIFEREGVDPDEALYLYQFLSSSPELTDPEMFAILKFDQYKYWTAGVPFVRKWTLRDCITRDLAREAEFKSSLNLPERYAVMHTTGSSFRADVDPIWLDPAVHVVRVEDHQTDSIFDWISVLEGAEAFVGIDSVMANMVDSLQLAIPELYWIRRSGWDLTPVLGLTWTMVPSNLPCRDPERVDPAALAAAKAARSSSAAASQGSVQSMVPFPAAGAMPTNFMHALRNTGQSGNINAGMPSGEGSGFETLNRQQRRAQERELAKQSKN